MKNSIQYLFLFFLLASCGSSIDQENIIGCWKVAYIDTDGVKIKSGAYQMCFDEDGTVTQQRNDGKEKITMDWSLEAGDSLLVFLYEDRKPDTLKIVKSEKFELAIQRRIKTSKITLYLRKEK